MKEYIAKHVTGVNKAKARLHVAELYVMRTHLYILMPLGINERHWLLESVHVMMKAIHSNNINFS